MLEQDRPPNGRLRASDADREGAASLLRQHHLDGRLDAHEFEQRLQRCLSARTLGELRSLVLDLPRTAELGRIPTRPGLRWLIAAVAITVALAGVSLATGGRFFFPAPLAFFAIARFGRWHWRRPQQQHWADDRVVGA